MGLKPYDRKISQIFNNIQYDIDFYQREYKWSDNLDYKPVSSLLRDIFYRFDLEKYNPNQEITEASIDKLEWYYLNSFMTNNINGKKYIVDGQQRLTTLTLISIGLYHISIERRLPSYLSDSIKNSILGTTEFGTTYWMGFKDRKSALSDLLTNNLDFKEQAKSISEINIYSNYKLIYEKLEEKFTTPHLLQTFISYFRQRIYFIEIEIDKDKDVAMVFEVINDRGVPLKPYEILKGKILSQINIDDRDTYIEIWESQIRLIEKHGEIEIDEFFGFFFRSRYSETSEQHYKLDRTRYHKTIFTEEFESKIGLKNNEANAKKFIKEILPYYTDIYVKMLEYGDVYQNEYEYIYFNVLNSQHSQFLLTLSSIKYDDPEKYDKIKLIPKYFDRIFTLANLTGSYKSNDFNTSIISLSTDIRNKNVFEVKAIFDEQLIAIVKKAHSRESLDDAFKYEFFKNIGYNDLGSSFLRYFFARIDHYLSNKSKLPEYASYHHLV